MMDVKTGFVPLNGTELYCEETGRGTPVVFIHGLALDRRTWDHQFSALADRYRVIRYDLRGFGKSSLPGKTAFRHCDDLRALLDHLQAPRAHVVGLSMGGTVALQHALLYPAATLSLVLVDSSLDGYSWSEVFHRSFDAIAEQAQRSGAKAANEQWLRHDFFVPANEQPDVAARLTKIVSDYSGWGWLHESPARGIKPPSAQRLHEVRVPTLVIVGERDLPDFQIIATTLASQIPGADKVVIRGAGHAPNMEKPAEVNSLLLEFLKRAESIPR